jgi:hypothetical protein
MPAAWRRSPAPAALLSRDPGSLGTDGGAAWTSISRHREAAKVGALDGSRVAEAWDKRYVNGRTLRFHAGPQP